MPNRDHLQSVPDEPGTDIEVSHPDLAFDDLPMAMWAPPVGLSEEFEQLHASLTDALRRDARHLPTGVVAALQLERVAGLYIKIRYHESTTTWPNERYREWAYKTWRALAKDVSEAGHSNKIAPEQLHLIVSSHTAKIVASVLSSMPDDVAKPLYRKFAQALEEESA